MDKDPYDVECGANHTLVLTRYGTIFAWGNNNRGQCGVLKSSMNNVDIKVSRPMLANCGNISQISAGAEHSAILDDQGKLQMFGSNNFGQLGIGSF